MFVDGIGLLPCEAGQDFGRPASRGQQHIFVLQFFECADEGGDSRGLARTGVAAHQQQVAGIILHGEFRERVEKPLLARCRRTAQMVPQAL